MIISYLPSNTGNGLRIGGTGSTLASNPDSLTITEATLITNARIQVGWDGEGYLKVDGGKILNGNNNDYSYGRLLIGDFRDNSKPGSAKVEFINSKGNVLSEVTVGYIGNGELLIENSSFTVTNTLQIAEAGNNTTNVFTLKNSELLANHFYTGVGKGSENTVKISGSTVNVTSDFKLGANNSKNLVEAEDSEITVATFSMGVSGSTDAQSVLNLVNSTMTITGSDSQSFIVSKGKNSRSTINMVGSAINYTGTNSDWIYLGSGEYSNTFATLGRATLNMYESKLLSPNRGLSIGGSWGDSGFSEGIVNMIGGMNEIDVKSFRIVPSKEQDGVTSASSLTFYADNTGLSTINTGNVTIHTKGDGIWRTQLASGIVALNTNTYTLISSASAIPKELNFTDTSVWSLNYSDDMKTLSATLNPALELTSDALNMGWIVLQADEGMSYDNVEVKLTLLGVEDMQNFVDWLNEGNLDANIDIERSLAEVRDGDIYLKNIFNEVGEAFLTFDFSSYNTNVLLQSVSLENGVSSNVPEPATWLLLVLGCAFLATKRK